MLAKALLPEQRSASKGVFSKPHICCQKVALHPPSTFDTPNHIIADFKVFVGLLRQRLDSPSAGEYSLYDKSVLDLKEKVKVDYHRNFMGFIFQAYHLIEEMTVYENIETPLIYKGVKGRDRQSMVADLLDRLNMVAKKDLFSAATFRRAIATGRHFPRSIVNK